MRFLTFFRQCSLEGMAAFVMVFSFLDMADLKFSISPEVLQHRKKQAVDALNTKCWHVDHITITALHREVGSARQTSTSGDNECL